MCNKENLRINKCYIRQMYFNNRRQKLCRKTLLIQLGCITFRSGCFDFECVYLICFVYALDKIKFHSRSSTKMTSKRCASHTLELVNMKSQWEYRKCCNITLKQSKTVCRFFFIFSFNENYTLFFYKKPLKKITTKKDSY